jgi:hypothetical protein
MKWPAHLHCSLFPPKADVPWCFGPEDPTELLHVTTSVQVSTADVVPTNTVELSSMVIDGSDISSLHTPLPQTSNVLRGSSIHSHHTRQTPSYTIGQSDNTHTLNPTPIESPIQCQDLPAISMCSNLGYNKIGFPNSRHHTSWEEAEYELNKYQMFIITRCSSNILQYLCYYYMTPCKDGKIIPPCRELCYNVQQDCTASMDEYKLYWPSHMRCDDLPSTNCSLPLMQVDAPPTVKGIGGANDISRSIVLQMLMILAVMLCVTIML